MPDKNSPEFIQFIRRTLKDLGRLKKSHIDIITAETHHEMWRLAFTTKYESPDRNYELFELFGDEALDCAFLHYLRKKYPILSERGLLTATVARLKINYLDVETFSNFSVQYGMADWVDLPDESAMNPAELAKYRCKHGSMGIYEDVLEAFYGVTERLIDDYILDGLSTTVIRNMLAYMYENSRNVSLDFRYTSMFEAKTRLKQMVDYIYNRDFGVPPPDKQRRAIWYQVDETPTGDPRVSLQVAFPMGRGDSRVSHHRYTIATVSTGERQKTIEKRAAEIGIQVLAASGYSVPDPPQINTEIEYLFGYIDPPQKAPYFVPSTEQVETIPGPANSPPRNVPESRRAPPPKTGGTKWRKTPLTQQQRKPRETQQSQRAAGATSSPQQPKQTPPRQRRRATSIRASLAERRR